MTRRSIAALAALATISVPSVAVATWDPCWPDTTVPTSTTEPGAPETTTTSSPVVTTTPVPTSTTVVVVDTTAPTTTVPAPTTTVPAPTTTIPGPVVVVPEPQPPAADVCLDPDGDNVGTWKLAVAYCFLTPEAELWHTVIWQMVWTYGISAADANLLLIRLLSTL